MKKLIRRALCLGEESYRIGPRAFGFRVLDEGARATGIDLIGRRVRRFSDEMLAEQSESAGEPASDLILRPDVGIRYLRESLSEEQKSILSLRAEAILQGEIPMFRKWSADFGSPLNFHLDPASGSEWPKLHSRRVLRKSWVRADVKFCWELGRMTYLVDLVRASSFMDHENIQRGVLRILRSFCIQNPLYQGVHWVSEQEAAIRGLVLCFVFEWLKSLTERNAELVELLQALIYVHADYCKSESGLARSCIDNNHFLAPLVLVYSTSVLFPEASQSTARREYSRRELLKAVKRQWNSSGDYVQPSFNYHRLALSYLLWCCRFADYEEDSEFSGGLRELFSRCRVHFSRIVSIEDGTVPNYGANDGSLFLPLTECDYRDFRPLLYSLSFAVGKEELQDSGPWSEEVVWLWGDSTSELQPPLIDKPVPPSKQFVVIPGKVGTVFFRAGSIASRYGQQADQLHVDLKWKGREALVDAGSFSYHLEKYHDWFRSTAAHNTVELGRESQMRPYRRFLFLGWPKVRRVDLPNPPSGIERWFAAWHDGYRRLEGKPIHYRLVTELSEGSWAICDKIRYANPKRDQPGRLRWHLADLAPTTTANAVQFRAGGEALLLRVIADTEVEHELCAASEEPVDGWVSYSYGVKQPAPVFQTSFTGEISLVTLVGNYESVTQLKVEISKSDLLLTGLGVVNLSFSDWCL